MRILIFGKQPPPIGGVTKSVENIINAFDRYNIEYSIINWRIFFKCKRYDVAHIHYSNLWKILFCCFLAKIVSKKIILTKHGNEYNSNSFNFKVISKVVDGVIFLNVDAYKKYFYFFKYATVLSSLFEEGILQPKSRTSYFKREKNKKYILVYANNASFLNNEEIYGITFVLNSLYLFPNEYTLILLDPNQAYSTKLKYNNDRIIYLNYEVDFFQLLKSVDLYLRPTSTDGASVAIQEALILGVPVVASDCVPRPDSVFLYKHNDHMSMIRNLKNALSPNTSGDLGSFKVMKFENYLAFVNKIMKG